MLLMPKRSKWRLRVLTTNSYFHICVFLFLVFQISCSGSDIDTLYYSSAEEAAKEFVEKMIQDKRCESVKVIAVLPVEGDQDDIMRTSLTGSLLNHTSYDVVGVPEQKEIDIIIQNYGKMMKYQELYDEKTLLSLGKLIGYRFVIKGEIISLKSGPKTSALSFRGQVIDLRGGKILLQGKVKGLSRQRPKLWDGMLNFMITALLFLGILRISQGNYFAGEPGKKTVLWFLVTICWIMGVLSASMHEE